MAKSREVAKVMGLEKRFRNVDMELRDKFLVYSENLTGWSGWSDRVRSHCWSRGSG